MWMPEDKCKYFTDNFPDVCPSDPTSEFQQFHGMQCVPVGWFSRLVSMCSALQAVGGLVQLTQVKQDFGNLRVHTKAITTDYDLVEAIVRAAENDCTTLCAICGNTVPQERRANIYGIGRICSKECSVLYRDAG